MADVFHLFSAYADVLERDAALREQIRGVVKEIDVTSRRMSATLELVHSGRANEAIGRVRETLPSIRSQFQTLAALIPAERFYQFSGMFSQSLQSVCFSLAYVRFLESLNSPESICVPLVNLTDVEIELGLCKPGESLEDVLSIASPSAKSRFHVPLEDFLISLTSLSNELSRLAVNSVTRGDYAAPRKIYSFLTELTAAFRMLNLKNDVLRRRFDSMKYDIKKVEEINYDLSIRKLGSGGQGDS